MKRILFCLLLGLISLTVFSQSEHYAKKTSPYHATAEEQQLLKTWYRNTQFTTPPAGPVTAIAEFQPMGGVMIAYPLGVPVSLVSELSFITQVKVLVSTASDSNTVETFFAASGVNTDNVSYWVIDHDSYWTRDYGPWFILDGNDQIGVVDFTYNRPSRPHDDVALEQVTSLMQMSRYEMPMVHTGGNYMVDGYGTAASTTLVLTENENLTASSVQSMAGNYLGINNYMLLDDPLGDYIEHIDCWGKFLDVDKVLIGQVSTSDSRYYDYEAVANTFANALTPWGNHYQVYRVFTPGGWNRVTPFSNSLILNDHVFVPVTGTQWDDDAVAVYQQAMPGYTIVPIMQSDYTPWENTDALHCRTHELADPDMLYIKHYPLLGNLDLPSATTLQAEIKALSGQPLVSDSLLVYYRKNQSSWQTTPLLSTGGSIYEATFTDLQAGDVVDYYIFAQDESGRSERHPYIGAADPHQFNVQSVGIEENITPNTIALYPNPCSQQFAITCPKTAQLVEVFDLTGKKIFQTTSCDETTIINASNWISGIYMVRITDKNGNTHNRKVVKR